MDRNGKGPAHPLPKRTIKSMLYQLVKGLAHCHRHGVMHRDLKPQNLLVDDTTSEPCLKVADLGLGRAFSVPVKSYTHEIVTLWYRAPEVLLGSAYYACPVDMWSVGCIFAELVRKVRERARNWKEGGLFVCLFWRGRPRPRFPFSGEKEKKKNSCMFPPQQPPQPKKQQQPLFPGDSEWQQLLHIFKLLGTPNDRSWPGVTKLRDWHEFPQWRPQDLARVFPTLEEDGLDLLRRMLQYDPSRRISAKEALRHPYFDDLGAPPGSDPAADRAKVDALENPELEARAAAADAGVGY
jgi:cyclin-dependent kinase